MTALVTALGLLPLALGGLVTSTALNLFVLPILAARCGNFSFSGKPE